MRELQLHGESTHPLEKSPHPPSFVKPLLHLFIHYMQVYEDVWGVYGCATLGLLSFCKYSVMYVLLILSDVTVSLKKHLSDWALLSYKQCANLHSNPLG